MKTKIIRCSEQRKYKISMKHGYNTYSRALLSVFQELNYNGYFADRNFTFKCT